MDLWKEASTWVVNPDDYRAFAVGSGIPALGKIVAPNVLHSSHPGAFLKAVALLSGVLPTPCRSMRVGTQKGSIAECYGEV